MGDFLLSPLIIMIIGDEGRYIMATVNDVIFPWPSTHVACYVLPRVNPKSENIASCRCCLL